MVFLNPARQPEPGSQRDWGGGWEGLPHQAKNTGFTLQDGWVRSRPHFPLQKVKLRGERTDDTYRRVSVLILSTAYNKNEHNAVLICAVRRWDSLGIMVSRVSGMEHVLKELI